MTPRQRLVAALSGGRLDRPGVSLYEFSHLDSSRPRDEPGYAALAQLQRRLGETFTPVGVDLALGAGDPNVVTVGGDSLDQAQLRTVRIATPKGELTGISRREVGNLTWWQVKPLVENAQDCRKWLSLPARPARPDFAAIAKTQQELGEEGLVLIGPGDALGLVCGLFHYDGFLMTLLEDEALVLEMLEAMNQRLAAGLRLLCAQVRGACIRFWGPEYAGAPLLNPHKYFPKLVVRFDRPLIKLVNESGNYSVIHCHGYLAELLDYLEAMAPTALEPLEVRPATTANVTMRQLKDRLGDKMCLMGGIQAAELELHGPAEVRRRVRQILEVAAPGGRYVVLPTSAPIEYPLRPQTIENYRAYFEAVHEFGPT